MINWLMNLKNLFEGNQLNKDSSLVIQQAQQMFGIEALKKVASISEVELDKAHKQFGRSKLDIKRAILECRRFHKEALKQNDQKVLSAITLVIIFLRAELIGKAAAPARDRIDKFIKSPLSFGRKRG